MKNYYYILGIEKNASIEEVKVAYRKLSVKFHPDKNDGDKFFEDRFKDIQEAYETISNIEKRKIYDLKLTSNSKYTQTDDIRNYEEKLKKEYEDQLKKKEEEIKRKYQTPEQKAAEEFETKRRQEEESKIAQKQKLVSEFNSNSINLRNNKEKIQKLKSEIDNLKVNISVIEEKNKQIDILLHRKSKKSIVDENNNWMAFAVAIILFFLICIISSLF